MDKSPKWLQWCNQKAETISQVWRTASSRKKMALYFLCYTGLFIILMAGCFSPFLDAKKSLVWANDGRSLYLPNLYYYSNQVFDNIKQFLTGGGFTMYDFSLGFGGDATRTYFAPISQVLTSLLGDRYVTLFYTLMTIGRLYLIGISFSIFCRYLNKGYFATLLGAITYTFSGYVFYACTHHSHFALALILLPLLLLGLEMVLRYKSPVLFVFVVFYSMWTSYYFLYINSIFMFLYAVLRVFDLYQTQRIQHILKLFFQTVCFYLLGIGMAALAVLPQLTSFGSSSRTSSFINTESLFYYQEFWPARVFSRIISPYAAPGYWIKIGVGAVVLIGVFIIFSKRRKEHRSLRIAFLMMTLFLLVPVFAYIFSGFSTIQNRWTYGYTFLLALILTCTYRYFGSLTNKQYALLFLLSGAYGYWCLMDIEANNRYILAGIVMLLITIMLLFVMRLYRKNVSSKLFRAALLGTLCLTLMTNGVHTFGEDYGNEISDFLGMRQADYSFTDGFSDAATEIEDPSFYRISLSPTSMANANASKVHGYNSTSIFNSTISASTLNYMIELENADLFDLTFIRGFDNRAMMSTLSSVKYQLTPVSEKYILPFGYTLMDVVDSYDGEIGIYQNEYPLPLGYTYNQSITREAYDALSALEKQEALLQAVVLEEDGQSNVATANNLTFSAQQLPATAALSKAAYFQDNSVAEKGTQIQNETLRTDDKGTAIKISFEGVPNTETYLAIKGFTLHTTAREGATQTADLKVKCDGTSRNVRFIDENYIYYTGSNDRLINLGYSEAAKQEATITIPADITFSIEDIAVYSQPMDNYIAQVKTLQQEALENIVEQPNQISGTITVGQDKMLCVTIPYSSGWSATVDGVETPLSKANTMYMALPVTTGTHEIVLTYQTPNLVLSLVVTGVCFGLFLFLIIFQILKRRAKHAKKGL